MTSQKKQTSSVQQQASENELAVFSNGDNFALAQRIAKSMAQSDLVPKEYQNNVSNVLVALEMSNRMNASPLMVMQNLNIIYGRPSFSSTFLIASINASNRFDPLKYKIKDYGKKKNIEYVEFSKSNGKSVPNTKTIPEIHDKGCIAYTKDRNTGETLESPEVTIEMAIKEGWYTKSGSKWKTMPELMLRYRAAAFWQRLYAPEITMGMKTDEEIQDAEIIEDESGENQQANQEQTQSEHEPEPENNEPHTTEEKQEPATEEKEPSDPLQASMQKTKASNSNAQTKETKSKSNGQNQSKSGNGKLNFNE